MAVDEEQPTTTHPDDSTWERADRMVDRLRRWIVTAVVIVGALGGFTAWIVTRATAEVKVNLNQLNENLQTQRDIARTYAVIDSVRYERAMDVLELAVTAIVAPDGSPEQKSALDELKSRRHVVPR